MHLRPLTYALGIFAVLCAGLGILLDLWFYAVAACGLALYLTWRYTAFRSYVTTLHLDVTRVADRAIVRRGEHVTFTVSVVPNAPVYGEYADTLPRGVELVDGRNVATLALRAGEHHTMSYTVRAAGRANVVITRATLAIDNGLFTHTIALTTAPSEVRQPLYAVSVEGGPGAPSGISSTSVQALYRERRAGAGFEISHLRPYVAGDALKRIHWKASARLNQLVTKELRAELDALGTSKSMSLIIDQSGSMGRGAPGATELDFAVNVASHFVKSAVAKGNRIGMVAYDDEGVTKNMAPGDALPHVSNVVRSLNELEPGVPLRRPRRKGDLTGAEVARIKEHFSIVDTEADEDVRHFRRVVSYLYRYSEGYLRDVKRAPAFQAINAAFQRSPQQSTLVLVSDLENDLDSLTEGIRLAARRGRRVCVIALFPRVFERFDDPLLAIEDVHAAYEAHRLRTHTLAHLPNVTVIEANATETLRPVLKEARTT